MIIQAFCDGVKTYISSKGNPYADIFIRGVDAEGSPDFEQLKLRTFDEKVIKTCQEVKKEDLISFDITIRDATIEGVNLYV